MRQSLTTDRLLLRDITESDAQLLFDLDSDPEVMRFIGARPADDITWYQDRIRTAFIPQRHHSWHGVRMVFDRTCGEFLGWVFVRPAPSARDAKELGWTISSEIEVGYRYHRIAWGRGIATEAAMPLVEIALADPATSAIVACALAGNKRSLRVLEKLGLKSVGEVLAPKPTVLLRRSRD